MRFILASASPARLQTLKRAGVLATPIVSGVDESRINADTPAEQAAMLARAKAQAVAERGRREGWLDADALIGSNPTLIVGCDSVLELDGKAFGKPGSPERAAARWRLMRGRTGRLLTGHHVIWCQGYADTELTEVAATEVRFADLDDAEIAAYAASGEPSEVAGAFTIDGRGGAYVESISGDPHNVVGISLPLLRRMLLQLGVPWHSLWE
jgi:septum formation protein